MIFISAPDVNFDAGGRLTTLVGASVWARERFTPPEAGTYRIAYARGASPSFTTTGSAITTGGVGGGGAARTLIFAPVENFNDADELLSLSGCVLSLSTEFTQLLGTTSYRAVVLSPPSPPVEGGASLVNFTFGPTVTEILDFWSVTFGAERIDVSAVPSATTPIATFGQELITVTG